MADMLRALVTSRKAWVLLLAIVGVVAMNLAGKVTGSETLDFVKWLVGTWLAAVAAEDVAKKMTNGEPPT